nr:MAG TPA: hypothetical protein [Bacteriophage sp.]
MKATMTILGLYNYDNKIFDDMQLPEGVDAENVISNLLMELAELEVIYPSWITMRRAISDWSKARVNSWALMLQALSADYDPIENYDRREDWTDGAESGGGYQNKVAGFNVGSQTDSNSSEQQTKSSATHSGRVHGNIGVTMAQQMIQAELDLRAVNDIVQIIVNEFKKRFCIMVY